MQGSASQMKAELSILMGQTRVYENAAWPAICVPSIFECRCGAPGIFSRACLAVQVPYVHNRNCPLEEIICVLLKAWKDTGIFCDEVVLESPRPEDGPLDCRELGTATNSRIMESYVIDGVATLCLKRGTVRAFDITA
jgi:hypothetical protein